MWVVTCQAAPLRRAGYVSEGFPLAPRKPRLLDAVRNAVRIRHYSRRTERAYLGWIRRYILFHGKRHPADMGAEEVTRFLSSLAVEGRVSSSTQNQALSALLLLYGPVLGVELPWLDELVRATRPQRLPAVVVQGGSARDSPGPAGHTKADGSAPLRRRPAPTRVRPAPRQGHRLRGAPDRGAEREG